MALSGPSRPAASGQTDSLVVFVHGYGADGNDLIGLAAPMADELPNTAFVAPDGPERCPGASRQWFAITELDPRALHQGVVGAAPLLRDFIAAELKRRDLTAGRLALVGFSQGTMLSLALGLGDLKPAAVVGFSGLLTGVPPPADHPPPVFLAHGADDPLIPPDALLATASALGAAGVRVQWHVSPETGHGIDDGALALATGFLKAAFAGKLAANGPICSPLR
jgi:phospholipase/carboxylesterase